MLARIGEHTLYHHGGLGPSTVVLDLGANRGVFSRAMVERYGCQVYAVEANPYLCDELRLGGIRTEHVAVSDASGPVSFAICEDGEWSSLHGGGPIPVVERLTVEAVTLADLLERLNLARVDILKLDVEGAEVPILMSAPDDLLMASEQVTVEFHDFHGFTPRSQCEDVIRRMESLGFRTISVLRETYGDVLFVNRDRIRLLGQLHAKYWTRNWWGLRRVMSRMIRRHGNARDERGA